MVRLLPAWVVLLLSGVAVLVYWPTFHALPVGGDNLYILAWVDAAPFSALLRTDPRFFPEWRPLAYLTFWIGHRLVPLEWVAVHHAVNLATWVACAVAVYVLVVHLARSHGAALVAALLLLTNTRALKVPAWIIERQTSMACLFGLLAFGLVVAGDEAGVRRGRAIAIGVLLAASGLSKEYGLAFALALAAHAWMARRGDLAWAAGIGLGLYGALRLSVGGALATYCEDMYFANEPTYYCIDPTTSASLAQMAYNVASAAVGILVQGVLSDDGRLDLDPPRLMASMLLLVPTVVALAERRPVLRLFALVPVFTAGLSFMVYRDRNHLVAACAMRVLTGVGLAACASAMNRRGLRPAAALLVVLLIARADRTHERVRTEVEWLTIDTDPCGSSVMRRSFGPRFVHKVKFAYGMNDPSCAGTP